MHLANVATAKTTEAAQPLSPTLFSLVFARPMSEWGSRDGMRAHSAGAPAVGECGCHVMQLTAAGTRRQLVELQGRDDEWDALALGCAQEFLRHQWRNSFHERTRQPASRDSESWGRNAETKIDLKS